MRTILHHFVRHMVHSVAFAILLSVAWIRSMSVRAGPPAYAVFASSAVACKVPVGR